MPWYTGPSLMHYLETSTWRPRATRWTSASRSSWPAPAPGFPRLCRPGGLGQVAPGDEVLVLPSRQTSRVRSIVAGGEQVETAGPGDSVIIYAGTRDRHQPRRHDRAPAQPAAVANKLESILCWLSDEPLDPQRGYLLQHTTRQVSATISQVHYRIDVDTLEQIAADTLGLNEIGQVQIDTTQPLFFDPYAANRATGSFILIDPYTHNTVAAGMIRSRSGAGERRRAAGRAGSVQPLVRPRSTNVVWKAPPSTARQREQRNGHKAAVLWFTGLSGAGKSTIAQPLERRLFELGCQTFYLDGDNVRHGLNGDLGFTAAARKENIRRVAEVAKLAFDHGQIVLCTFISPFRADRDQARALLPAGAFLEIAVRCDLEECMRRDPKGLYKRALRGELPEFTGVSSPYEEPLAPELTIATDALTVEQSVQVILLELRHRGILHEEEYEI